MSYSSSVNEPSTIAKSRFAMDVETGTNNAINERVSRVFADYDKTANGVDKSSMTKESIVAADAPTPLPRRKPLSADTYVHALGDALPRPKPVIELNDAQSKPLDLTDRAHASTSTEASRQRFGALDLSAFLRQDVLSSTKDT